MTETAALAQGAEALGLSLAPAVLDRLSAYARLLLKWNRVYNLTSIRDPSEVVSHHLLDSLSVLPWLGSIDHLADVGSGGGLPGIPLAIARPDLQVVSIEAVGKKASFQQQARIELGLDNFLPVHGRIEDQAAGGFDGVISRAFAELGDFVRVAGHLLAPGGRMLAMKGVLPAGELAALPPGMAVERTVELHVPSLAAARHLIILKPDGAA
ncbi:MAG: 16S rRNA (guanine(527)-N(7))-methyltransferase RsmG [Rhodocyclaceae bacterium]|nr:16S rRNA (guanine(527)-N(7))-methyltransferase RsmG [Rhodocyclaceae bacterium]